MTVYQIEDETSDLHGAVVVSLVNDVTVTLQPHFSLSHECDEVRWELSHFVFHKDSPGVNPAEVTLFALTPDLTPISYSSNPKLQMKPYANQLANRLRVQVEALIAAGIPEYVPGTATLTRTS